MGIFDKIKGMVSSDDLDYNDYDGDLFGDDTAAGEQQDAQPAQNAAFDNGFGYEQPQAQANAQQPRQEPRSYNNNTSYSSYSSSGSASSAASLELKVVKLDRYDASINAVADHLLNRRTVVLNLENANKESAHRILDFLSGVVYSIDGNLKHVATNTFVITPNNVDVSNDQYRAPEAPKNDVFYDAQQQ